MGLRRTSLVLYILFIFHLHHNLPSVSSRPSSVDDTNHESTLLPLNASKPEVVGFEGKARELAVVIKKGGGGGRGGGGRGGSRGGRSRSRGGVIYPAGGSRSHHSTSSGSQNLPETMCALGWLGLSVLAGLFLV